jgi:hypothetical protein
VAALHTADYLPLEMSPEPDPVAIDVAIIAVQPEEQQWAAAIDFDLPDLAEPLPLPEVEEIGLDGTLLPDDWGVDASPQTAAPPPVAAGQDAPPATLAGVDSPGGPVAEASDKANEPLSHPLDAAVLLPEAGNPVVDSDSTPVVVPPAGLVTEEGGLPPESPVLAEVESVPVPAPREDPDEPAPRRPFSDSLITSDSFEE